VSSVIYCVVFLYGIVLGVISIWLCVCWCAVLCFDLSVFGCVFVGVWYWGGIHLPWIAWLLLCGIVLDVIVFFCVVVGVWYHVG